MPTLGKLQFWTIMIFTIKMYPRIEEDQDTKIKDQNSKFKDQPPIADHGHLAQLRAHLHRVAHARGHGPVRGL